MLKINYLAIAAIGIVLSGSASSQEPGTTPGAPVSLEAQRTTRFDSDVTLGKPIEWESPKYPKHALESRLQGTVVLKLTVARDGKVKKVETMSGDSELADSAVQSAHKWRYVPYFMDAKAVEAQTMVTINFKVTESGQPDITATYKVRPVPPTEKVLKVHEGVTPPRAIYAPDPGYSDEALKTKYEGVCVLALIVGPNGWPYDIKVSKSLGKGLDEKAIEAVQQWRFKPATKNGQPVSVAINVEIQFRLGN